MAREILAEFETSGGLLDAVAALVEHGPLEAFTPFPIRELEETIGHPRSRIPLYVLVAGLGGATYAFLFQWWANAFNYPLDVGGRPLFSAPAFIPITFEGGVLAGSLTAFFSFLGFCGLPRLWHPLNEIEGFERASIDRFFLKVGPGGDLPRERIEEILRRAGAIRIHILPELGVGRVGR